MTVAQTTTTGLCATYSVDDEARTADMRTTETLAYTDTYGEFSCGAWKSVAMWNGTGRSLDTALDPYAGPGRITDVGERLPYLRWLVSELFDLSVLRYARIARLTPGSVLVPHRDYLELDSDLIRIHLPLETDDSCLNSDETTIYHMDVGEIWFLDATRTHSALSGWDRDRTHLVLDFRAGSLAACFAGDSQVPEIPESRRLPRDPLDPAAVAAFERGGALMDLHNHRDFLKIAIKGLFTRDITPEAVFDLWEAAARHSPVAELATIANEARTYFLLQRES